MKINIHSPAPAAAVPAKTRFSPNYFSSLGLSSDRVQRTTSPFKAAARRGKTAIAAITVLMAAVLAPTLQAQTATMLNGSVLDPTGAAIPNVVLVLENLGTRASRNTKSDGQGAYAFVQVTPGEYRLTAKAAGFSDVMVNSIRLLVNTPATVNVTFEKVGAVAETISVIADATQVNTTDATVGNSFGTKPITQLPFEGRNVVGLLSLQPGVSFTDQPGSSATTTDRSGAVNGGRSDQANVTLDGIDVNEQQTREAFKSVLRVTLDSVQEFRVTTTNANADQGRSSGAQVALITKGGTNTLHGSAYEYLRNKATNANSFINNAAGVPLAQLNRNVFGASAGGPIKKDKLFFFMNYEGRRDATGQSVLRTVPSATLRQGIVRYVRADNTIASLTSQDLATRLDPLNIGANKASLDVLGKYPLPNSTEIGDGINSGGYRFNAPIKVRQNTYIAKFDYLLNTRHQFFARGNLQNDHDNDSQQFAGAPANNTNLENSKGVAFGWTGAWSSNFLSNTRFGFTRQGIENTGVSRVSQVSFRTFDDLFGLNRSFRRFSPLTQFSEDLNWTKGSHNVQFGGLIRKYSNDRSSYANSFFGVSANASWLSQSGAILNAPFTDMAPGFRVSFRDATMAAMGIISQVTSRYNYLPKNGTVTAQAPGSAVNRLFKGEEYEMYVQDSWKVKRNLTVTYGLRFGYFPPIYEANGVQTSTNVRLSDWFDQRASLANAGQPVSQLTPIAYRLASSDGGRPLYDANKNWQPRFAIAYAPTGKSGLSKFLLGDSGKSSIRAGFGVYHDLVGAGLIRGFDASALGLSTSLNNPSGTLNLTTAPRLATLNDVPASLVQPPPPATFPVTQPNNFAITNSLDDKLKSPYSMNYNVTMTREVKGGWVFQGSYVARLSKRTLTSEDIAAPTNFKDPQSGMDYYTAAQQLTALFKSKTPVSQVPKIAFWENVWPALAGGGLSATQGAYNVFADNIPDTTTALESLDRFCDPACSKYGKFTMFNPQYSYLRVVRSVGFGTYHGMQWAITKRFGSGDQLQFNYTWAKSIDLGSTSENNQSATTRGAIIQPFNRKLQRSVSDFDTTHSFNANWIYGLPFGKGHRMGGDSNKLVNAVIGGWQLSGLTRISSGFPTSVGNGRFWPTNYNVTGYATQIAAVNVGTNKNAPKPTAGGSSGPNLFADPSVAFKSFENTTAGLIGNRNNLRGDGIFNIDTSLAKRWLMPFNEKHSLQFRWEVFNMTNTTKFDPLNITLDLGNSSAFGRYTGQFGSPRVMQFGLRYEF